MLKELIGYFNSIKKIQEEMKFTLSEVMKIYRESTVEWMKARFKSIFWNIRKKKTFNQNRKKKKESNKQG